MFSLVYEILHGRLPYRCSKFLKDFWRRLLKDSVWLEACSMCQLSCPACSTGSGFNREHAVGWGYLKFKDFRNFIDKNPSIKCIQLSNYGEIFLNPELKDIIKYAFLKKIKLSATNGVNLNVAGNEVLECLVKYEVRSLLVSLDGATPETYRIYRRGGNFDAVIKNIKKINEYKKQYGKRYPELSWQFIIFGHNYREIGAAREMARKLNMGFRLKFNNTRDYSPIEDKAAKRKIEEDAGVVFPGNAQRKYRANRIMYPCLQLWIEPQINWDGKLLGCCSNKWGDFGNVFKSSLKECLKSEKYIYAKKMISGKAEAREDIPCSVCPNYHRLPL
jgi:MoaA/NifB/PqqE/SkfB family radical SAM enzyme